MLHSYLMVWEHLSMYSRVFSCIFASICNISNSRHNKILLCFCLRIKKSQPTQRQSSSRYSLFCKNGKIFCSSLEEPQILVKIEHILTLTSVAGSLDILTLQNFPYIPRYCSGRTQYITLVVKKAQQLRYKPIRFRNFGHVT